MPHQRFQRFDLIDRVQSVDNTCILIKLYENTSTNADLSRKQEKYKGADGRTGGRRDEENHVINNSPSFQLVELKTVLETCLVSERGIILHVTRHGTLYLPSVQLTIPELTGL